MLSYLVFFFVLVAFANLRLIDSLREELDEPAQTACSITSIQLYLAFLGRTTLLKPMLWLTNLLVIIKFIMVENINLVSASMEVVEIFADMTELIPEKNNEIQWEDVLVRNTSPLAQAS